MESKDKHPEHKKGAILSTCPVCQGKGKVPRQPPFWGNPKAPLTRTDRLGLETCRQCRGTGRIGVE